MKKLISLLLVIVIICSVLSGCVYFDKDFEMKKAYLDQFGIKDKNPEDVIVDYDVGTYNGARIVMLDAECRDPEKWMENIGDFTITYYDSNRLLVWKDSEFITLTQSYWDGLLGADDIKIIIAEYDDKIKQFADVCDVYDFSVKPKHTSTIKLLMEFDYESIKFHELVVVVDPKLSQEGMILSKEFFGDFVSEISCWGVNSVTGYPNSCGYLLSLEYSHAPAISMAYVISKIESIPGVLLVAPMIVSGFCAIPSDPAYINDNQWGLIDIQVEKVWDFTIGSDEIVVGVVDSGIANHEDLDSNIISGWDFYNNSNNATDDVLGHGTHIAGIIGAIGNNGRGISGVNWEVKIISLQNINVIDNASYSPIYNYKPTLNGAIDAIEHAISTYSQDNPIRILNMSFALGEGSEDFKNAIDSYRGLVVCSAGNSGINLDNSISYPQHYDCSNIIVVGAIDSNRDRAIWNNGQSSNYGELTVDIYAPGTNIYSTTTSNTYKNLDGSSEATPYVSGVAALLLSVNPNLESYQIKNCILNGADDIEIVVEEKYFGLVQVTQSVKCLNAWGAFKYMMENYPMYEQNIGCKDTTYLYNIVADAANMKDNTSMMKFNVHNPGSYTFTTSSEHPIEVKFYDSDLNEILTTQTISEDNCEIEFSITLANNAYYIRTNYVNNSNEGTIRVEADVPPYTHTYTEWAKHNSTHHIECCEYCGVKGTRMALHYVKQSEISLNIGFCAVCGAKVMLGDDIIQVGPLNAQKVTPNGSYLLPNGIPVLVDEDIEAYLNGTLVWYDKDDLPQTQ